MPAVTTNLVVEQGATWAHGWRVRFNGDPITAAWTAHAQLRAGKSKTSALLHTFTASVSDTGDVVIGVPFAASEAWDFTKGYYDVEVTSPDGETRLRVAQGSVKVSQEVTDD
jgi:hypothetical protein